MSDLNKSSSEILDSAFRASFWALGLLFHAVLICVATAVLFTWPNFSKHFGEQSQKALHAIEKLESEEKFKHLTQSDLTIERLELIDLYNSAINEHCPDCHFYISTLSYYGFEIVIAKIQLYSFSKIQKKRLTTWIGIGKFAQVLTVVILLFLTFVFWKAKKQGFLNWVEKFLLLPPQFFF